MTVECLLAMITQLCKEPVAGKRVVEVGSQDVNGSIRPFVEALQPKEYIGTDMAAGKGVDVVCDCGSLEEKFGAESFDLVISTSLLEHVRDWRSAVHNMKAVCRPGGTILVTTVSRGFQYHGYPYDFWRYAPDDLKEIFSDCEILALEPVNYHLVLIRARKPLQFSERSLDGYPLHSILANRRVADFRPEFMSSLRFKKLILGVKIQDRLSGAFRFIASRIS